MIDHKFLRTSIEKYVRQNDISEESVLTLEYLEAPKEPTLEKTIDTPDWISAIASSSTVVASVCYDGTLRMYGSNGEHLTDCVVDTRPLKAVAVDESGFVVTGGKGGLKTWQMDLDSNDISAIAVCEGHENSIESVAISETMFASGSWDGTVRLWQKENEGKATKKQRTPCGNQKVKVQCHEPFFNGIGHSACVSGVAFQDTTLFSGSKDRSIKLWALETMECKQTLTGSRPICDLAVAGHHIATAHPDHMIRIWDTRASESGEQAVKSTLKSHTEWVSRVCWLSDMTLASASYDGCVKVWDIRSTVPFFTLKAHEDKALGLASMANEKRLISGGADCKMQIYSGF